jgi:hypothetical protein
VRGRWHYHFKLCLEKEIRALLQVLFLSVFFRDFISVFRDWYFCGRFHQAFKWVGEIHVRAMRRSPGSFDTIFLDFVSQRVAGNADEAGGCGFVAAGLSEGLAYQFLFHFVQ